MWKSVCGAVAGAVLATAAGAQTAQPPGTDEVTASLYAFSLMEPAAFAGALDGLSVTQREALAEGVGACLDAVQNADAFLPRPQGRLPEMLPVVPGNYGNSKAWAQDMRRTLVEGAAWGDTVSGGLAADFAAARPMACAIAPEFCRVFPARAEAGFLALATAACGG
jgi:hypothetical protein